MLRVSTLDVWTPRWSNPRLRQRVNDLTACFGGKNMTLFGLDTSIPPQHVRTDWHRISWIQTEQRESRAARKSLTANQLYMSSVWEQRAASHFWNLHKATSPLKPYLTHCLAAIFSHKEKKPHKTLCKTSIKGMYCLWPREPVISPCMESTHQALLQRVMWDFGVSLSGRIGTTWTQTQNRVRNDRHLSSDTLGRKKCRVVMSVIITLSASDGNRTRCAPQSSEHRENLLS